MIHKLFASTRNGFWRLCLHKSHRLRLPCYRFMTYDGYCGKHNDSCFFMCRGDGPRHKRIPRGRVTGLD